MQFFRLDRAVTHLLAPVVLGSGLVSCKQSTVADVMREFRSDHYVKTLATESHRLEVRYFPNIVQRLLRTMPDSSQRLNPEFLAGLAKSMEKSPMTFILKISPADTARRAVMTNDLIYGTGTGYANYAEAYDAYQNGIKTRIWVEASGQKIPVADIRMEDSYGLTPGRTFILQFRETASELSTEGKVQLVLDDIVPGLSRRRITWCFPLGEYDQLL